MKKISFSNFSALGLVLMSASALTSAFIPSKAKSESSARSGCNGIGVLSTNSVFSTVVFTDDVNASRSYTATGLSATSDDNNETNTAEHGEDTGFGTTAAEDEDC